ncbi:MAG: DNA translocase FtsK, partial [Chloroflexi bacterium]|nr:DNA translocase FtsK [Chloroflexota bacterium]
MASTITREYLEFQSDRIEAVLASHKIPVRVHGGAVAPRWIRFHFTAAPSAKLNSIRNLSEEIAMALGAPDVRLARDGDSLALEVPRPDAESIRLLPLMKKLIQGGAVIPPVAACIGVTDDGRPLLLRLPSPDVAHVLVAGMTGSGKTELMRTLLVSLAAVNRQSKLQMALIDPK